MFPSLRGFTLAEEFRHVQASREGEQICGDLKDHCSGAATDSAAANRNIYNPAVYIDFFFLSAHSSRLL